MNARLPDRVIRVLVNRDRTVAELWVAHALDGDFVAQGRSFKEALASLPGVLKVAYNRARSTTVFDLEAPAEHLSTFARVELHGVAVTMAEAIKRTSTAPALVAIRWPFVADEVVDDDHCAVDMPKLRSASPGELVGQL